MRASPHGKPASAIPAKGGFAGAVLFALARGGREIDARRRDEAEKPAAVR